MSKYQYILLDWDGNLAKTLDLWLDACKITFEKRGLNLSDEEIASSFGVFSTKWHEWGIKDVDDAIDEADKIAKQRLPNVELYPDALEVLDALHSNGKKLALITASIRENILHILEKYNLNRYFDVIITRDDVTHHKPHPEPLDKALKKLGGNKSHAIMIGDSDKDLGAAKNAGIDSILFYPPEHKKFYDLNKLKRLDPTYIVSDFRNVINIILSK